MHCAYHAPLISTKEHPPMSMNKRNFVAAGMGLAGLWTATGSSHAATQAKAPAAPRC